MVINMKKGVEIDKKTLEKGEKKPKIGDYIRTKGGRIGKIVGYTTQIDISFGKDTLIDTPIPAYLMDTFYCASDEQDVWTDDMIKSSGKRLIDVIESGDLVNMLVVFQVTSIMGVASSKRVRVIDGDNLISLNDKDIRHVVCHEVLEDNGYENK